MKFRELLHHKELWLTLQAAVLMTLAVILMLAILALPAS